MFAISFDTSSSTFRTSHPLSPTYPPPTSPLFASNRVAMDTSVQPFNTGGVGSPGAPPTEYPSISLDTEMLDEDEIMAMEQTERSAVDFEAAGNPQSAVAPENTTPNKIHLRGLDNMSSNDVKIFVASHFPEPAIEKLEWIDDTSLNLVYKDGETAAAALTALTAESGANAFPWELREAKRSDAYPLARLDIRLAVTTDRKEKGARERSRYYLFHPEEDRIEQEEKRRRERDRERKERRRENSEYRQRDYAERRYRSGSRDRDFDRDDRRSRSRYDGDENGRKEPLELFPNGTAVDRRSSRRSRSRSPVELFPEKAKNSQVELFPEKTKNESTELFPEKVKNASVELFPEQTRGNGRRREGSPSDYRLDTPPRTLFSIDDPIEMPRRGQSPPRQRRDRRRDGPNPVELFPEKTEKSRSLADRISGPQPQKRGEDMDMEETDSGLSIRGAAGGGLSFRGAASGQTSGHKNAGIELLPDKPANSLFNRISDGPGGRRGSRRQKAEDMFG
ncbi:hypothetical protein ABW19_dt0202018 [Dactylella cylindrospora]|nr:hypothetical protein ABW19_dt0202018 [Dactylella cylindrospora]